MIDQVPAGSSVSDGLTVAGLQSLSDTDLAIHLLGGNDDALGILLGRYKVLMLAIARRIVKNHGEAEEVMQQASMDMYRGIAQFDPAKGSFKMWLRQIVHNRAINRKKNLGSRHFYHCAAEFDSMTQQLHEDWESFRLHPREVAHCVQQLLEVVQPRQRVAIELMFFEGLTPSEISTRTGESFGVVRHNIYRGLNRMRSVLEKHHVRSQPLRGAIRGSRNTVIAPAKPTRSREGAPSDERFAS